MDSLFRNVCVFLMLTSFAFAKDPCKCMDVEEDGFGGIKKLGYEFIKSPERDMAMYIGFLEEDRQKFLRVFVRKLEANYESLKKSKMKISFYEGSKVMELEMGSDSKPAVKGGPSICSEWKIDFPVTDEILKELYTRKIKAIQYMHFDEKMTAKISNGSVKGINKMITCLLTPMPTR